MNVIDKATVMHYHRHRIEQYAAGSTMALGWKNQHSQDARFAALAQFGSVEGCTVLDVGCGHGDLKAYLDQSTTDYEYIGLDMMPEFIATAQKRFSGHANTAFYMIDFSLQTLPVADYVFACGALSYRSADEDFLYVMIRKLYAAAGHCLALNLLDAAHFPSHPLLKGYNREAVVDFCRGLSGQVELVTGYAEDDFTVFMRR